MSISKYCDIIYFVGTRRLTTIDIFVDIGICRFQNIFNIAILYTILLQKRKTCRFYLSILYLFRASHALPRVGTGRNQIPAFRIERLLIYITCNFFYTVMLRIILLFLNRLKQTQPSIMFIRETILFNDKALHR